MRSCYRSPAYGSPAAATVGNDVDDADPQGHAGKKRGESEPFMKSEMSPRARASFRTSWLNIHRAYSPVRRQFKERYAPELRRRA
jgi:hypothetical protein